jgi:hypothetical protein
MTHDVIRAAPATQGGRAVTALKQNAVTVKEG